MDIKKKEPVESFKNSGRTWRQAPLDMLTTDFMRDVVGKAVPYGVYDLAQNERYVVVGRSHETPAFAVAAIRSWWLDAGRQAYPGSHQLLIEADSGGADGDRNLRWKISLQALANEFDLTITVTHYPTSASKWNPVKHCLFGLISGNWAVQSLCSFETVLKFIRATRTETELHCRARPDTRECATGLQVTKEQKAQVHFGRRCVLPKYNYTIQPQTDIPQEVSKLFSVKDQVRGNHPEDNSSFPK